MAVSDASGEDAQVGFNRRELLKVTALVGAGVAGGALMTGLASTEAQAAPAPVWAPVAIPAQVPVTEGMVDVGGCKLWYWDTGGNGQPVILMHSGTHSGEGWGYQQPVLAKAGYRVIGYSRRGYYKSEPGDNANPGAGADDLGALINFLKLDKVHLIAHAHGGYFATDYTISHPEKVRSLSIVASLLGIKDKDYTDVAARIRPKFFGDLPHDFQELGPSYRAGNPEGLAAWLEIEHRAIPGTRIDPKMVNTMTWAALETIKLPVLLVTGDADLYLPPACLRMQAQHLPQAEVVVFDEAGHCPGWEQPEAFNKAVLAFLAKH